jgi:hypothetical protein
MSEIKVPTVGRTVHYFPSGIDEVAQANGATVLPAIVIQVFGTRVNLQVLTMNPDAPNVLRYSVAHKSDAARDHIRQVVGEEAPIVEAHWDWPEIK